MSHSKRHYAKMRSIATMLKPHDSQKIKVFKDEGMSSKCHKQLSHSIFLVYCLLLSYTIYQQRDLSTLFYILMAHPIHHRSYIQILFEKRLII